MPMTAREVDDSADGAGVRPVLDDALDELNERDREALLLRFFEGRGYAEIGVKLSLDENAARMRVDRALGKLQGVLGRRGVTSTMRALATVLARAAGASAPAGVAATVTGAALAGGSGGAGRDGGPSGFYEYDQNGGRRCRSCGLVGNRVGHF